jgi:membrane fusion protein
MPSTPPASPPDDDLLPLFRREALDAYAPRQYGDIVLLPGAGSRWIALAALCVVAALIALVATGSYTRRSTVIGQVQPSEGLIRVSAAQPGVVIESRVKEGQEVAQGDVMFVLSGDRLGPDARDYQGDVAAQIETRQRSLEDDRRRTAVAEQQEAEQLRRRVVSLRDEKVQLARQADEQASRLALAEDTLRRHQGLFKQDFISRDELLPKEADVVEQRSRLQGLKRDALVLDRDMAATERELDALRARFANQRAEIDRAISTTKQESTEVESRRRIAVTAPSAGRVTLLQAEVGQTAEPLRPLAHVVPSGATLVARLYVPSRAAGFTRPGATVLVRYDAFPYQKFGQHEGKVLSVSTAAVAASEIVGLAPSPENPGDPLFAVTVALPAQSVGDGAQTRPLQAGMRLEADLLQETRRLYEWILEPLYTARARVNSG